MSRYIDEVDLEKGPGQMTTMATAATPEGGTRDRDERDVHRASTDLNGSVETLEGVVSELCVRLSAVLRETEPDAAVLAVPRTLSRCTLSARMDETRDRVEEIARTLADLVERLQV